MSVNLLEFERTGFAQFCAGLGEKPFRARQLMRWIHRSGVDDFDAMTDISKASREEFKKDRKSTRLNSSHSQQSRMPSSA